MKNKLIATITLFLICILASAQSWPVISHDARPGARWWWLGSAIDEAGLEWNMREYATRDIGTLEITPLYGVIGNEAKDIPFLSPKWMDILRLTEEEGRRDSIEIDMNCGTGWPFGGPSVKLDEAACKMSYTEDTIVSASNGKKVVLTDIRLKNEKEREYAKLQRVMAYPIGNHHLHVLDVTEYAKDGTLIWHTPKGKWHIIALYASRTRQKVKRAAPGGEGWVMDHFDSTAVAHYLNYFAEAFKKSGVPYPHTFFNDSYEVYNADWTPSLLDEFEKRRGYKLEDHLPELLGQDSNDGNKILVDYRETLSDMLLENFTCQWTRWAHSHGVITRNQAHGSPTNLIDAYAAVDIPEIESYGLSDFKIKGLRKDDVPIQKNFSDLSMLKYASSAAHITGKNIVSSETFTWLTEHFRTSLSQCKPDLDLIFCSGVNHVFFHGTCYSPADAPWPGWKFYASIDMSPTNSIWRDAPYFMKYIERCQSFLQMGKPDNDFLIYLPVYNMWAQRTKGLLMQFDIHTMDKKAPHFIHTIQSIDSLGYDCDYISDKYLMTTTFDGKMLCTAFGAKYKGLIIPDNCILTDETRKHIEQLQAQGASIIFGIKSTDLSKVAAPEAMKSQLGLKTIRRSNDNGYHYFISNLTPDDVDAYVPLTINYSNAILFNPLNGERYEAETKNNKIKICLKSGESIILQTFTKPIDVKLPSQRTKLFSPIELTHGWTLKFIDSHPRVDKTFQIDTLHTWETLADDSVKTTMGTGVYSCKFNISKSTISNCHHWAIDLGDVRESARVYINDQLIGCAWSVPYILHFDDILKAGKNMIRIEVTNLPANRIADMDRKGIKWRRFKGLNMVDISYKQSDYSSWKPVPSGMNSHVKIYKAE